MSVRYFWLLDVTTGGRTYRYSTEDLDVVDAAGTTFHYAAGLASLELAQGDAEADVAIVDASVDWPAIGRLVEGSPVILRRWREGTRLERAEVYAKGTATEAEWETAYDPVEWTIRPVETLPPMPAPEARVSPITTEEVDGASEIPPGQVGMYYPIVFGVPGRYTRQYQGARDGSGIPAGVGNLLNHEPVVPCPMRILYTGAATAPDSQIVVSADATRHLPDTVLVREDGLGMSATLSVIAVQDTLGRQIGVADLTADFTLFSLGDDGPVYLAAYSLEDGGVLAPRSAYDVIVSVLREFGGDTVDWTRIPEVETALQGYLVDTWINEGPIEGGVWGWLVEALGVAEAGSTTAAGLPVAIRTSAEGRYLVALRYTTDPARTVRTIDTSRGEAARVSSLRTVGAPVNACTVKYGYDLSALAGEMANTGAVLAASGATISTGLVTDVSPNSLASSSRARFGVRQVELAAPWTWDHATATRLAHDLFAREALPAIVIQYRVPEEWGLREGDQVALLDAEVGIDDLAIVEGPPYVSEAGVTVTLRIPGEP